MKDVFDDEKNIVNLEDLLKEYKEPSPFMRMIYRIENFFKSNIPFFFRDTIQKIFRKDHVSDYEVYEICSVITKFVYPKLKRFAESDFEGTPFAFCDYDENAWKSREEYDEAINSGKIVGGEMAAWKAVLKKMLMSFEYENVEQFNEKGANEFFKKWNYKIDVTCPGWMGLDEYKRFYTDYEEGFLLFGKYLGNLCD